MQYRGTISLAKHVTHDEAKEELTGLGIKLGPWDDYFRCFTECECSKEIRAWMLQTGKYGGSMMPIRQKERKP